MQARVRCLLLGPTPQWIQTSVRIALRDDAALARARLTSTYRPHPELPLTPLFRFDDVHVRFGEREVLAGIDLDIDAGGTTVLAGPSGSGKTTLLRLCNRLEVPTSGRVLFRGEDVATLDPLVHRRRVGMVFQRPTLFAGTVRDNLHVARPGAADTELGEALGRVGLASELLSATGDTLSGGEAQRACLARTLLTGPEVLLLDEPTSSLDPAATRVLEHLVADLAAGGMSALWVSHDPAQARRIGDARVVLLDGRIVTGERAERYLG